jgi:hypothetical protein
MLPGILWGWWGGSAEGQGRGSLRGLKELRRLKELRGLRGLKEFVSAFLHLHLYREILLSVQSLEMYNC